MGRLGACAKYHCLWLSFFFVSSPRLQVATVDRFSRSIRQTTRLHARKCLLGISMMNFHIYPFLFPKTWKFALRPMATLNDNKSGIFKDRSKMFAPKWGFSGSGNLTASSNFPQTDPCYHDNQLMILIFNYLEFDFLPIYCCYANGRILPFSSNLLLFRHYRDIGNVATVFW